MATYEMGRPQPPSPKLIAGGIVALLFLVLLFNSFVVVGAGQRGVLFSQISGIRELTLDEGLHFKLPFIESVLKMDVRIQKSQTSAAAASKDLQNVAMVVAVNYHLDPDKAYKVYQEIGRDFESRVIDPTVQESVKATTAHFTAEELIVRRGELKERTAESLAKRLAQFNIFLDEFSLIDFSFSEEFNRAIEAKQTAEQQALKAKRDLDRIKIEAEQRITQARAESEAQRLQKETITPILLQLRAIEKWNGIMPQVTGSAMPFIDLKTLGAK